EIDHLAEVAEPDAPWQAISLHDAVGVLHRETSLADAGRSQERHQCGPLVVEARERGDLFDATEKAGRARHKVRAFRPGFRGAPLWRLPGCGHPAPRGTRVQRAGVNSR